MLKIVKLINKGPSSNKHDDDLADRLSSRYTVLILVVFTIAVSSQLYIGKPINCWCPKEFQDSWIKYTNNYCWVKNTYYLPLEAEIPRANSGEREGREILYYQWLPFVMLTQALFFYLPSAMWHAFNSKAGVDCDSVLAATNKYHFTQKADGRKRLMTLITNQMDRFLLSRPETDTGSDMKVRMFLRRLLCCVCGIGHGKYLILLYLFTKVLYMANVVAQFFMLNALLRTAYSFYGYELFMNIMYDKHWINSESFPRVTMCDFNVRRLGNNHKYTVQCVLPINMYTEKIYAFMWVWMLLIAIISGLSLLQWMLRFVCAQDKYRYIRSHLRNSDALVEAYADPERQKHAVADFVDTYLRQDGVFVLRMIGHNTNNMTVGDTTRALWENWLLKQKKQKDEEYDPDSKPSRLDEPDSGAKPMP